MGWLWLDIQIYKFSLPAIPCPVTDRYYFPISRAFSTHSDFQNQPWLGLDSIKMGAQDRRSSTLTHWTPMLALCLPLSLFVTIFMLHQFMSFLQHTIYTTNYFPNKVKSWSPHWVSPSFCITHQVHAGIWAETVSQIGLPFPTGREIDPDFPATSHV